MSIATNPFSTDHAARDCEAFRDEIEHFKPFIRSGINLNDVAAAWSREIPAADSGRIRRFIASRLSIPHHAANLTHDGRPARVDLSDPRIFPDQGGHSGVSNEQYIKANFAGI